MIEDVIKNGFNTWRRNIRLSIPFVLEIFVYIILAICTFFLIVYAFGIDVFHTKPDQIKQLIKTIDIRQVIAFLMCIIVVLGILSLIVMVVFKCWQIKACYDAINGNLSLKRALGYVRQVFKSYILLELIFALTLICGLVSVIIALVALAGFNLSLNISPTTAATLALFSILLFVLLMIYLLVIVLLFTYSRYAVVLDRTGAIAGIKTGFRVLKACFWETVAMYLIVIALQLVISIPFDFARVLIREDLVDVLLVLGQMLATSAVVTPITTTWWVLMYMRCRWNHQNL